MPYVALLRITPRPDHRHDDAYAVGPFDDQAAAHAYGLRTHRHPQEHYGTFLYTAELIDPTAFARIRPSPAFTFDPDDGDDDPTTIVFTTNLGHAGTITHTQTGWHAVGTTPDGDTFNAMIADPAECAMDAKLRLLHAVDNDRLPSYPPHTPAARHKHA